VCRLTITMEFGSKNALALLPAREVLISFVLQRNRF
jgi:hypothetical protein